MANVTTTGEAEKGARAAATSATPAPEPPTPEPVQYSIFTKNQKQGIVVLVAFAAVFSPLSSFIYYPARNALANDLHVSLNKIDLTITSYMVVSGVIPALVGGFADVYGRRPAYLIIFTLYVVANVGLAFQKSYPALMVLRMVQSAGSSGLCRCLHNKPILYLTQLEAPFPLGTESLQILPIQLSEDHTLEHSSAGKSSPSWSAQVCKIDLE